MDTVTFSIPQMPMFLKAIGEVPKAELKSIKRSLNKGMTRTKKLFIRTQLKGAPGINAGKLATGRNVFSQVKGSSLGTIVARIGISRILHVHEKGLVIKPTRGRLLALHEKNRGPVFAMVPQVRIPARLKFRQLVANETPHILHAAGIAAAQTAKTTLQKGLLKT